MASYGGQYKRERPAEDPNNGYDMPPQKRAPPPAGYEGGGGGMPLRQARPYPGGNGYGGGPAPPRQQPPQQYQQPPRAVQQPHPQQYSQQGPQRGPHPQQQQQYPQQLPMRGPHPAQQQYQQLPMGMQPGMEGKACNVLVFTVLNPKYPITVDVMHTICAADNRPVNRILIHRNNGIQAMVEFDSVDAAERAKEALQGADIYSGCCTLQIEFGKTTRVAVTKNDTDSWDYTNPNLGKEPSKSSLLPNPQFAEEGRAPPARPPAGRPYPGEHGGYPEPGPAPPGRRGPIPLMDVGEYGGYGRGYGGEPEPDPYDPYRRPGPPPSDRYGPPRHPVPQDPYHDPYGPPVPRGGGMPPPRRGGPRPPGPGGYHGGPPPPEFGGPGPRMRGGPPRAGPPANGLLPPPQPGCVLMVYGCPEGKVNCQKLFNLFCLYGNVIKIKFLKNKGGVAMVQMADMDSCQRATQNLSGTKLFSGQLSIAPSKQDFIQDVHTPTNLSDGEASFVDFSTSRNNRFLTEEAAAKNRVMGPSKSLYLYNAPASMRDPDIVTLFKKAGVKPPVKIKIFPSRNDVSSTAVLEWETPTECVEALAVVNHTVLENPSGKNPFIMKLSFTGQAKDHPHQQQY